MQTCPALEKLDQNSCSATFSTSASASTIEASLPPSSSVMRFKSLLAPSMIFLPVAVEPVKVILSIPGWLVIIGPSSSGPVMMLTVPAGTTSLISSAMRSVVSGVKGEGLSTMVQPATSAGTIFWIDPVEDIAVVGMIQLMGSPWPFRNQLRSMTNAALVD